MNRPTARLLTLLGFGALMSQAGHLLVFQIQFGSAALAVQGRGAHAYFPAFAKTSLGIVAAVILSAALVVGASRLLEGRPRQAICAGPTYLGLLARLFSVQLAFFFAQETIEALMAGTAVPSSTHLLLFGTLGQLPVALIAALALKWLATRFETALITLRHALATTSGAAEPAELVLLRWEAVPRLALAATCPSAYVKRGPPPILQG